jgi:predicted ester cyclase
MSTNENKQLIERLLDAHERSDPAGVREVLSPKLQWHVAGAPRVMGREDYMKGLEQGHAAFSDLKLTVDDLIAEGDRVAARLTIEMHHTGDFLDLPPTGRSVTFSSAWFYRIVERHVVEAWVVDEDFVSKLRTS